MKRLLFVYDSMMLGGTTTALLSVLNSIDYEQYQVDLQLFQHTGPFMDAIPENVHLLSPIVEVAKLGTFKKRKWLLSLMNGQALLGLFLYLKYRGTPKGNLRMILYHCFAKAQTALSRPLNTEYDAAIGFIEGWSDHYVLSDRIKANKRLVWIHPDYKSSYLIPEFDKAVLKKADRIVAVSEECCANMQAIFPMYASKIACMENIISPTYIRQRAAASTVSIDRANLNLCTVCRCDIHVKGLDRLLHCFTRLKNEGLLDGVRWHLIGDGDGLDWIKQYVAENDLTNYVTLYGSQTNPFPYLSKMDAFLLVSRYEGKPVSVSEALVMALPCLVTRYASADKQVADGITGLVTENSEEGVYTALHKIVTDKQLLVDLKKNLSAYSVDSTEQMRVFYEWIGE